MIPISFVIAGEPVPKGRPRFARGHAFTPEKTRAAEKLLAYTAKVACFGAPLEVPVKLTCRFFTRTARRGDLDNLVKLVSDALNGVVFVDDRLVVALEAVVGVDRIAPRTEVRVEAA